MGYTSKVIDEILEKVQNVKDFDVLKANGRYLDSVGVEDDAHLASVKEGLGNIAKGVFAQVLVITREYGLDLKRPTIRPYLQVAEDARHPNVTLSIVNTPSFKFKFKESMKSFVDESFRDEYISFLESAVYNFVTTAIAEENISTLNSILDDVKRQIVDEDMTLPFDLSFAHSDRPFKYMSSDKLVLGANFDTVRGLISSNSPLVYLFSDNENVQYLADATRQDIIEEWTSSANPLIFVRKHNQYLMPFTVGDLNSRHTYRVDVLIKKSFTLTKEKLEGRKEAIAYDLVKTDDGMTISIWEKTKDSEPKEILPPVDTRSLAYVS